MLLPISRVLGSSDYKLVFILKEERNVLAYVVDTSRNKKGKGIRKGKGRRGVFESSR